MEGRKKGWALLKWDGRKFILQTVSHKKEGSGTDERVSKEEEEMASSSPWHCRVSMCNCWEGYTKSVQTFTEQALLSRDNMVLRDQVALSVWGRKDQRTIGTSLLPSFTTFWGNLHRACMHCLSILQTISFARLRRCRDCSYKMHVPCFPQNLASGSPQVRLARCCQW